MLDMSHSLLGFSFFNFAIRITSLWDQKAQMPPWWDMQVVCQAWVQSWSIQPDFPAEALFLSILCPSSEGFLISILQTLPALLTASVLLLTFFLGKCQSPQPRTASTKHQLMNSAMSEGWSPRSQCNSASLLHPVYRTSQFCLAWCFQIQTCIYLISASEKFSGSLPSVSFTPGLEANPTRVHSTLFLLICSLIRWHHTGHHTGQSQPEKEHRDPGPNISPFFLSQVWGWRSCVSCCLHFFTSSLSSAQTNTWDLKCYMEPVLWHFQSTNPSMTFAWSSSSSSC